MQKKNIAVDLKVENKLMLSEIFFLVFWSLILFGRAIGWYEGQLPYNVLMVIAFLFWGAKMLITGYSPIEWVTIVFLVSLSFIIYFVSGEKGIIMCTFLVLGVKRVSTRRVLLVGTLVWGITFFSKLVFNLISFDKVIFATQEKNVLSFVDRFFMGYSHPNVFHISYFMLCTLLGCLLGKRISNRIVLFMFLGNILVFFYSFSLTGLLIVCIYLLGLWISKKELGKWSYFVFQLVFPGVLILSILLPIALKGRAFEIADRVFNNRIALTKRYLQLNLLKPFGNNLAKITDSISTMDNSFVFALITYGLPMFLLICIGYFFLIEKLSREKRNTELITTLCLLVGGFTEPYLFNMSTKNISLIFLGNMLFASIANRFSNEKVFCFFPKIDRPVEVPISLFLLKKKVDFKELNYRSFCIFSAIFATIPVVAFSIIYCSLGMVDWMSSDRRSIYDFLRNDYLLFLVCFIIFLIIQICVGIKMKGKESGINSREDI